ncbi:MAG TPA: AMP-binding protein [Dermatophilaceae bacterium]|nr:AMP-binding protein [Dermatophilaceae bacterium]
MGERGYRYTGEPPPPRFNMAAYCLGLRPGAPRDPDRVGLVVVSDAHAPATAAQRWTYAELDDSVRAAAAGLLALGLQPGERVMLRLGNSAAYPLLFFGAVAAGLVAVPTSAQLTAEEALLLLADSGARAVVMSDDLGIEVPDGVMRLGPERLAAWQGGADRAGYSDTDAEDPAFLVYTSGTTGRPKGVLHAHRSAWGRRPMYQGWYGIGPDDVMLHAGALNWTYTLGVGLTDPWATGATGVVYNGGKDPTVWPVLMQAHRASLFAAVPGVFRQLLRYTDVAEYDLSALRHGLVAGEALSPTLYRHWRQATGTELYEALGMSECSTFVSSSPSVPVRPGCPGRPQPGRCVVVLPADGDAAAATTPLPAGASGALAVHRTDPGLMLGYWNRPQEEGEVFRGEWFVGGDLAHLDEDGYVHFHGRADDVMNAMGYRVSPLEVEAVLAKHPLVADVAVAELPIREGVSVVAAFVVVPDPDDPDCFDAAALMAHAAEHLAGYKRPREIIFVDALPRTANGKVRRRELAGTSWAPLTSPSSGSPQSLGHVKRVAVEADSSE